MIRQLTEADCQLTLDFLSQQACLNLFQIGDIENHGFDSSIQTVWGSFNTNHNLNGVLLRYRENYIPYFKDEDFDVTAFKQMIQGDERAKIISGEKKIVEQFASCFETYEEKEMYFCELRDDLCLDTFEGHINIATPDDAERIFNLLLTIEEFDTLNRNSVNHVRQKLEDQSGRIYFMENEAGDVICNVQSTAENSKSAMIVGVATHESYRKLGLMSQTLSKLCRDLLSENKILCLFYNNAEAGSVYHKLGFQTIGKWKMLIRK